MSRVNTPILSENEKCRKPLLNKETDRQSILEAVKHNRQRVDMAKPNGKLLEKAEVSVGTFFGVF
jgi:hypothetical protein